MTRLLRLLGVPALMTVAACGDGGSAPKTTCSTETGTVNATATVTGANVVFDWEPRCPVALLLIEEEADDMWVISAPNLSNTSTEAANIIVPPVAYGPVPPGAEQVEPAATLIAGHSYELILWKVVPAGANVSCQARFDNLCMLAVRPFVR